ncbi:bidirectional sugar transporter SWEET4-like [Andrographis paniculata]|uniref:bidirectional sugar transporter SWEET4-like n=1 Tax=Andrographis paniculata TaxID=175694 RepID=UPI0021E78F3B|nr:bidirectional sugar transporter SWEET4-like [Andrographis paniculata]
MFSKGDARTLIGVIGNIISIILFLSPVPTFYDIWKKKSVELYSPMPYLATFINCGLWVLYGLPMVQPHSTLVVTINASGLVIELVYISLFFAFSNGKKRLNLTMFMLIECSFLALLTLLVLTLVHSIKLRASIVGSICMAGNTLMYASPLSVMKMVIKTKSVEYMPFFLSLFSFLNGVCWTSYALIHLDPFIAVPNGLGTLLGAAQLLLYVMFYKSTKKMKAQEKAQPQLPTDTSIALPHSSPTLINGA